MRSRWLDGWKTYQLDVHRVGVRLTVNGYGLDTKLLRCSDDPTCDLAPARKELLRRFLMGAIGDVPVGYEDLVEVRFMARRALKMVCLGPRMSSHSVSESAENMLLTRRCEVPRNSGKVRTENYGLSAYGGGSRGKPCCHMGWESLSPIYARGGSKGAIDGACRGGIRFRQHCGERRG